jgi:glycosyltransferase involved in cell wall biosynthesis
MDSTRRKRTVSFVVPALNEEGNIEVAVKAIFDAVNGRVQDYEIVLVNDGSTDQTGTIMERMAAGNERMRVVRNPQNLGYGGAFKAGAAAARMDYVVRICGDHSVAPQAISVILDQIGRADLVLPYIANPELRPWGRRLASRGFTIIINTLFGQRVRYYNHAVAFPREYLEAITITTNGFAYQAEALVKLLKAGCSYVEVGVLDQPRVFGTSTALRPKNLLSVFKAIVNLVREMQRENAVPRLSRQPAVAAVTSSQP